MVRIDEKIFTLQGKQQKNTTIIYGKQTLRVIKCTKTLYNVKPIFKDCVLNHSPYYLGLEMFHNMHTIIN